MKANSSGTQTCGERLENYGQRSEHNPIVLNLIEATTVQLGDECSEVRVCNKSQGLVCQDQICTCPTDQDADGDVCGNET